MATMTEYLRARTEQGEISGGGRVQGDALLMDDPYTGDEMGVYSAYTPVRTYVVTVH